jgi:hypothetical protein
MSSSDIADRRLSTIPRRFDSTSSELLLEQPWAAACQPNSVQSALLVERQGRGRSAEMMWVPLVVGAVLGLGIVAWYVRRQKKTVTPSQSASCPECSDTLSKPVIFTWWGGIVGPKMLHHVECSKCAARFNGRTGKSNAKAIKIYVVASVLVIAGALFALFWAAYSRQNA